MKKNYNQPIVEAAEVFATSLMQAASPAAGINAGTGGGTTGDINVPGGDPLGGD